MAGDRDKKVQEREKLKNLIGQWNANRLDIFWLTEPNEELEFHGAMRFYFQDAGQKVATKCIRVSSTAQTADVVRTLIEKFRPDIRMLSIPEYAIYEIHENGEERKLGDTEKPLLVQLDWHKDDREGRFLLRRMDEKSYISSLDAYDNDNFKRKLSKREKKEKKKREKKEKQKVADEKKKDGIAERLYSELPETSFTRSISNPEAVMRRRRQQILEQKLQQFCKEGGTDAGGTLRIFGESLNKDVPYKTLLLSMKDTAAFVVKEILEKYGHEKEDSSTYCLVQVIIPHQTHSEDIHDLQNSGGIREYILDDDDCPLVIEHQYNRSRGTLTFHVRRRPADYQPRKRKKKPKPCKSETDSNYRYEDGTLDKLPYLLEVNPDGSETPGVQKKHRLFMNVTEVGSERSSATRQYLQLFGPNVQPRHCVIAHTEGIVTVTPTSREAETFVNNMRIYETTILQPGMIVRFGKLHTFRFIDVAPVQKHRALPDPRQQAEFHDRNQQRREDQISLHHHSSYETTFDADGNVETVSTHSRDDRMSKKSDDAHSHRSLGRESSQGRGSYDKFEQKRGNDPILPAVLEFWEEGEDTFLTAVVSQLDQNHAQFKLSPTYVLYMAARFRASTHFRPKSTPSDRAKRLTALMNKIASLIHQVIQDRYRDSTALAFWLANASELLHFLKQDRHLSAYTLDAQDLLAESVQLAFRSLVTCEQAELQSAMPMFLEDRDDIGEDEGTMDVLAVLSSAMLRLRQCRVNAALTIQMFSQLFHYINMWLFNKVICDSHINLCTRHWGVRLKRRLSRIETWAEKQGLELAADCHLSRIVQAAYLLQAPKSNSEDLTSISSLCYKLNSVQLRTLLERYQSNADEARIPREFIDGVVKVAENTADEQARSEDREVKLEEDTDLQLPFLLPEDGYSCDVVRDVPAGLKDFLEPLVQSGLCRLTIQPTSSGFWTIYMSDQDIGRIPRARSPSVHSNTVDIESNKSWNPNSAKPEVVTISLQKSNNGIGLSIVAAGGIDQDKLGIYVKSVVKGGAADADGRLQAGDQLLKVDGRSLVGVNQEKAAELMTRTGPVVTLEVAKQGAIYNGIADLLNKPSPIIQRGPRRMSERDIPTRVMNDPGNNDGRNMPNVVPSMQPRMQSSKSVPSLNSGHHVDPVPAPSVANLRSNEMYNPAYSHTSSTASIPKASDFSDNGSRSKSASNLRQDSTTDVKYPYPSGPVEQNPPPYPGPPAGVANMNGRQVSQPNLHQHPPPLPQHQPMPQPNVPVVQEERHYQNISMYQQPVQQQQPNQQQNAYHTRSPSQPCPSRSLHGSQSSLNRTDSQSINSNSERSRPLSTLVSPREQEQYANSLSYAHSPGVGPPPSPKGTIHPGMDPRHVHHQYGPRPLQDHNRDFRSAEHLRHAENERKYAPDSPRSYHEQQQMRNHPMQHHIQHQQPHPQMQQQHSPMGMDPRQRDLLRQEAKMEEMREEVRRREERERMMQQQQMPQQQTMGRGYGNWQNVRGQNPNMRPPLNYHPGAPHGGMPMHQQYVGGPPPPAPKPRPMFNPTGDRFQRPQRYEHPNMNGSPMYPEGPHPMAGGPPANLNNPRMTNPPPPVVSYRYGPSGYPPRTAAEEAEMKQQARLDPRMLAAQGRGVPPQQSNNQNARVTFDLPRGMDPRLQQQLIQERKESNLTSPSPWEREEKEKLHKHLMEEKRRARDMEIRELESIAHKSVKQDERLRTLRLEQEFQRRAEEIPAEEDDDEEEDLDRADNREHMLKVQEDLEKVRQRRIQWEQEQHMNPSQHTHKQQHAAQEDWKRQQNQLEEQEGRLRQLRLEEVNRKRELEAARNEEERLLREARRRQDELKTPQNPHPPVPNRPMHLPLNPQQQAVNNSSQRVNCRQSNENDNRDIPPPLPTSPPPIEQDYMHSSNQNHLSKGAPVGNSQVQSLRDQQLSESYNNSLLVEPPAPPQRKSSYEVTNQLSSPSSLRYSHSALKNGEGQTSKKVSFHDPRMDTNANCDSNGNSNKIPGQSYTLDDIDEVLATPQNSQNLNMYNPGKTPGVIGAQEVYRDPRQRIEAERNQQENFITSRHLGPEKLTFKEKIKKFAKETGEPDTPRDKVKISRAQRDIETNLNGN